MLELVRNWPAKRVETEQGVLTGAVLSCQDPISIQRVDRHIRGPNRNKAAIIWEGENGDRRTLTYWDLYREVQQFANVLCSLGVGKGDRVGIYLPLIPEAAIAMLACARIGAIHSVVFGGFSPESLRDRMNDAQAKVLITADGGYRRGQVVPLKRNADKALAEAPSVEHVVVVQRRQAGWTLVKPDGKGVDVSEGNYRLPFQLRLLHRGFRALLVAVKIPPVMR